MAPGELHEDTCPARRSADHYCQCFTPPVRRWVDNREVTDNEEKAAWVNGYTTLDSGKRAEFPSGMRRDTQEGKPRYDLIPLWFLRELAELLSRGAEKYGDNNWTKADSEEEIARMDGSGLRHHFQYLEGDRTEDHLAATVFNLFAAEQTRRKVAE